MAERDEFTEPGETVALRTHTGRAVDGFTEHDRTHGRTFYVLARFGTITLRPDDSITADDPDERGIHLDYGRAPVGDYYGRDPLPDAPVVFGVTLAGATVFRVGSIDPARAYGWLHVRRQDAPGGHPWDDAPPATRNRTCEVVAAVALHWLASPDYPRAVHADRRWRAMGRWLTAQDGLTRVAASIAELQTEYEQIRTYAAAQRTLIRPEDWQAYQEGLRQPRGARLRARRLALSAGAAGREG